jgi:hypothetical protein
MMMCSNPHNEDLQEWQKPCRTLFYPRHFLFHLFALLMLLILL